MVEMSKIYDFEFENVKEFLSKIKANKVAVQLPDGLRPFVSEIGKNLKEMEAEPFFISDSCYGACDLADEKAEKLGCDAIIHYGHSKMEIPTSISSLFVEARISSDILDAVEEVLPELKGSTWGLLATVQHVGQLENVKDFLREEGIESLIGDPGPRCKYSGQILGCDWGSAKDVKGEVDGFLYFGTGEFHPKGVALATGEEVVSVNPLSGDFEFIAPDIDKFMRKRAANLASARSGESFGVLVSVKKGQNRADMARLLKDKLENSGFDSYILVFDEIDPETLRDYGLDAYANTACPRIPLSDSEVFDGPVLTPFEVMVLVGEREWDDYHLDEFGSIPEV